MGSRCVTGRLLLVVVRPDRKVDAPVDGGGRSLTDCVARLVTAPTSSILLRNPNKLVWSPRTYENPPNCMLMLFNTTRILPPKHGGRYRTQRARPMTLRPSLCRGSSRSSSSTGIELEFLLDRTHRFTLAFSFTSDLVHNRPITVHQDPSLVLCIHEYRLSL